MFYTYFKMYLLRQRTRTINQASKCNVIDKKITWPDWLENKDCAMLVFFFLLGFGIKYYKLLIKIILSYIHPLRLIWLCSSTLDLH